jgi:hypothetical protein
MVIVVGAATLIRRGWRVAALHVVPLAAIFGLWTVVAKDWAKYRLGEGPLQPSLAREFATTATGATFGAIGHLPLMAWVLAAILVVGGILAWTQTPPNARRARLAMPAALLIGMLAFIAITAVGRSSWGGLEWARKGRYLEIQAAMLLPAIALGADALARRWRALGPVVVVVLVVSIPGNISAADEWLAEAHQFKDSLRLVEAMAYNPLARRAPRAMELGHPWGINVGWLVDGADSGRIPRSAHASPGDVSVANLVLSLRQIPSPTRGPCPLLRAPVKIHLSKGQSIGVRKGAVSVTELNPPNHVATSVELGTRKATPEFSNRLVAVVRPLALMIAPAKPTPRLCRADTTSSSQR